VSDVVVVVVVVDDVVNVDVDVVDTVVVSLICLLT